MMHRAVETRLHQMQFERVYCKASHKRDDLYAYFIQRHQIAMGMIPDPKKEREERRALRQGNPGGTYSERSASSSESDISNFSLEIEMLNRMHVDKNNSQALADLPLVYEWQLPDPAIPLYLEVANGESGKVTFRPDHRPKIVFKDPVTKVHKK